MPQSSSPLRSAPPEALTGTTLGGRYELVRFLGRGALGADDTLSRLIRTASTIAGAEGRQLVPILDVGHDLERDLVRLWRWRAHAPSTSSIAT